MQSNFQFVRKYTVHSIKACKIPMMLMRGMHWPERAEDVIHANIEYIHCFYILANNK